MSISILKSNIIKVFIFVALFFIATPTFASQFYFETKNKEVSVDQQFQVDLYINTQKENINAIEGKIIFPADSLELSEIRSGNSVVNFWVDKPVYKDGAIVFSGITPGGYVLDKGLILSLVFRPKQLGEKNIKIIDINALKNDGSGTKSNAQSKDLNVIVTSKNINTENIKQIIEDTDSPDIFKPEVAQDPNLLENRWFVVFVAQDKGSSVDKYEVKESKYNIFSFSKWITAESPYVLTDQDLHSNIYIKAIDKKGNIRIVKLSPKNPIAWYANIENWFIIILVSVVAFTYFFLRKKNKK